MLPTIYLSFVKFDVNKKHNKVNINSFSYSISFFCVKPNKNKHNCVRFSIFGLFKNGILNSNKKLNKIFKLELVIQTDALVPIFSNFIFKWTNLRDDYTG
jgi:hypothetical protein